MLREVYDYLPTLVACEQEFAAENGRPIREGSEMRGYLVSCFENARQMEANAVEMFRMCWDSPLESLNREAFDWSISEQYWQERAEYWQEMIDRWDAETILTDAIQSATLVEGRAHLGNAIRYVMR